MLGSVCRCVLKISVSLVLLMWSWKHFSDSADSDVKIVTVRDKMSHETRLDLILLLFLYKLQLLQTFPPHTREGYSIWKQKVTRVKVSGQSVTTTPAASTPDCHSPLGFGVRWPWLAGCCWTWLGPCRCCRVLGSPSPRSLGSCWVCRPASLYSYSEIMK